MTTAARSGLPSPGMRLSRRILLVLILWAVVAAMTVGCLLPELSLPLGQAGAPPMILIILFLVVWIVALMQVSHKVPYGVAGLLLIIGPMAGPAVAIAASELYVGQALHPASAVVVAAHPRDYAPTPTDFRFEDGSIHRGVWHKVTTCRNSDCSYERLRPGQRVEVARDPLDAVPPRGPVIGRPTSQETVLLGLLVGSSVGVLIGTSISVIIRQRSLLRRSDDETEADKARTA